MPEKKKVIRKCVVCREQGEKKSLLRIVKNKDDEIFIDVNAKANGRGAYICKSINCVEKAKKTSALQKSFKCNIDSKIYDDIIELIIKEQ